MKIHRITILTILLMMCITAAYQPDDDAPPQTPLTLNESQEKYNLVPHLEILADQNQVLTFQQVSAPELSGLFMSSSEFDYSVDSSAYWIRLNLTNKANPNIAWLLVYDSYRMNHIGVYLADRDTDGYQEWRIL